ncbi:alpha-ketoglutarate-dependent dioxygenase AlkB family protein [Arenicella xantha]|uniref:DNA-N1-methyladenine dioxygenase n=1 Tax=Arenicella xantha TaxID=644221 RepID=A0A395JPB2_9GAMM|nr:alpha-ketoglutarate-dependent dioxygenase AlkB [Arenicella xantha]RBP53337.1 DNA-N1-methyladenine dioxygenase [Arenicella xantha]
MTNTPKQLGLLGKRTDVLQLPDADIEYRPGFLEHAAAMALFEQLLAETDWRQETVQVYGKSHLTPRLSCWMGDAGLDYQYSNMTMSPTPWSELLQTLKARLESATGDKFNSVLINLYRDGADSNGWHSDDEPELGESPVIASVSLGAVRDFKLRRKNKSGESYSLALEHGSLLMMRGSTQRYWQHQIPKRAHAGPRINLTFRFVY